jgi:hypothetical protein
VLTSVGPLGFCRCRAAFAHDQVFATVAFDDIFDPFVFVAWADEEQQRVVAHVLVLARLYRQPLIALAVVALTDDAEARLLAREQRHALFDLLVQRPMRRLVLRQAFDLPSIGKG